MYSASSRFNSITMTTALILATLCFVNFFHAYYTYDPKPDVKFELSNVVSFKKLTQWEQLNFRFNLDADLKELYTWNCKQLFVYIEGIWKDPVTGLENRAILYDWILRTPDDRSKVPSVYKITAKDKSLEYSVRDVHNSLKGNTLKVTLNIQYMPYVGFFFFKQLASFTYDVPQQYFANTQGSSNSHTN